MKSGYFLLPILKFRNLGYVFNWQRELMLYLYTVYLLVRLIGYLYANFINKLFTHEFFIILRHKFSINFSFYSSLHHVFMTILKNMPWLTSLYIKQLYVNPYFLHHSNSTIIILVSNLFTRTN